MIAGAAYAPETLLTSHIVIGIGRARIRLRAGNAPIELSSMMVGNIQKCRTKKRIKAVGCMKRCTVKLTHLKLCSPPPFTEGNAKFTITG